MAVPGLDSSWSVGASVGASARIVLPKTPPRAAASRSTGKGSGFEPPSWMTHTMKPIEVYNGGSKARSGSDPTAKFNGKGGGGPAARGGAAPVAMMMTGAPPGQPETSYKPSNGEPRRDIIRRGFFNDPDIREPGHRNKFYKTKPGQTEPRRRQQKNQQAQPATGGRYHRENNHVAPRAKVHLRSYDGVWKQPDEIARDCAHMAEARDEFKTQMEINAAERRQRAAAVSAQRKKDKELLGSYDPYKPKPIRTAQRQRNANDDRDRPPLGAVGGFGAPADHVSEGAGKATAPWTRVDRVGIAAERFDYIDNREEQVRAKMKQQAGVSKALITQVANNKAARSQKEHRERYFQESPLIEGLGAMGCGAPHRSGSGQVVTKLPVSMGSPTKLPPDTKLKAELLDQANEEGERKKVDRIPQRFDTHKEWNPFSPHGKKFDARKPNCTMSFGGINAMLADEREIDGTSLVNVMGTAGGGAPIDLDGKVVAPSFAEEEYRAEMAAQKSGASNWGKTGCGGPLKQPDGTVRAKLHAAAEGAYTGLDEYKASPKYRQQREKARQQQEGFMKERKKWLKKKAADQKADEQHRRESPNFGDLMNKHSTRHGTVAGGRKKKLPIDEPKFDMANNSRIRNPSAHAREAKHGATLLAMVAEKKQSAAVLDAKEKQAELQHLQRAEELDDLLKHQYQDKLDGAHLPYAEVFTSSLPAERQIPKENPNWTPKSKKQYHAQLSQLAKAKRTATKENQQRKLAEEVNHQKHANDKMDPGYNAPKLPRKSNGDPVAGFRIPTDPAQCEYRMLAVPNQGLT